MKRATIRRRRTSSSIPGWIFGKKRLIPAGVIRRVDDEERKVHVSMTKDQIKSAPDFEMQDRDDRDRYETCYGSLR